jgi:hypothetical protein
VPEVLQLNLLVVVLPQVSAFTSKTGSLENAGFT